MLSISNIPRHVGLPDHPLKQRVAKISGEEEDDDEEAMVVIAGPEQTGEEPFAPAAEGCTSDSHLSSTAGLSLSDHLRDVSLVTVTMTEVLFDNNNSTVEAYDEYGVDTAGTAGSTTSAGHTEVPNGKAASNSDEENIDRAKAHAFFSSGALFEAVDRAREELPEEGDSSSNSSMMSHVEAGCATSGGHRSTPGGASEDDGNDNMASLITVTMTECLYDDTTIEEFKVEAHDDAQSGAPQQSSQKVVELSATIATGECDDDDDEEEEEAALEAVPDCEDQVRAIDTILESLLRLSGHGGDDSQNHERVESSTESTDANELFVEHEGEGGAPPTVEIPTGESQPMPVKDHGRCALNDLEQDIVEKANEGACVTLAVLPAGSSRRSSADGDCLVMPPDHREDHNREALNDFERDVHAKSDEEARVALDVPSSAAATGLGSLQFPSQHDSHHGRTVLGDLEREVLAKDCEGSSFVAHAIPDNDYAEEAPSDARDDERIDAISKEGEVSRAPRRQRSSRRVAAGIPRTIHAGMSADGEEELPEYKDQVRLAGPLRRDSANSIESINETAPPIIVNAVLISETVLQEEAQEQQRQMIASQRAAGVTTVSSHGAHQGSVSGIRPLPLCIEPQEHGSSEDLEEEPPTSTDSQKARKKISRYFIIALTAIVSVAAVTGAFCFTGSCSGDDSKTQRVLSITTYINFITFSDEQIVYPGGTTPEAQALEWLIEHDPLQLSAETESDKFRLQQRYGLLTLWFQSIPELWRESDGWGNTLEECGWFGVSCVKRVLGNGIGLQDVVTDLSFFFNNMHGHISADVALLTSLRNLTLGSNKLSGSLPSSLGTVGSLVTFDVSNNAALSGSLPSSFIELTDLEWLSLFGCSFSGFLPQGMEGWTRLRSFEIESNRFTGTIPASVGKWVAIEKATFRGNNFHGTVPEKICNATNLEFLTADCKKNECACCDNC